MLRKLLKHEFRATGRVMLPLFAVLLVVSFGANFSFRGMLESSSELLNTLGGLLLVGYGVALAAVCIVAFLLMVRRFYGNLLQDEGYVMMTLPVSIHQQVWSKLIVSVLWFAATVLVALASGMIVAFDTGMLEEIGRVFAEIARALSHTQFASFANGAAVLIEMLIVCVLGCAAMCLRFYSAMAIGFSFPSRKLLTSAGVYIAISVVVGILESLVFTVLDDSWLHTLVLGWIPGVNEIVGTHIGMWCIILAQVFYSAIFYFLTTYFLKKKLNLE